MLVVEEGWPSGLRRRSRNSKTTVPPNTTLSALCYSVLTFAVRCIWPYYHVLLVI